MFNPFTSMSDQDRISPYNTNTVSSRQVMRINKISSGGLSVDPMASSPNSHDKNCISDNKENW